MVVQSVGSRRDDVQIWAESMCTRHIFCCAEQLKIGQRSLNLEVFRSKYDIEICKRFTSTPSTWRLHDFKGERCCANHLLFLLLFGHISLACSASLRAYAHRFLSR